MQKAVRGRVLCDDHGSVLMPTAAE